MLRRFNYTGRMPIDRSAVLIKVTPAGNTAAFDAKFDLSALSLPGHAKIYVEAYHRASYMRFCYGQVSDVVAPADRTLTDIEGGGAALFRLKVIDESEKHGRVLAEVDGISPLSGDESVANRSSILPAVVRDLGPQIWRVNFDDPGGRPVLELNKAVEGISQIAISDAQFLALVYPAAIRLILTRILRIEHFSELDGPPDDWRVQWLKFSCSLPTIIHPPKLSDENADDEIQDSQLAWIEDVVEAFCLHHKLGEQFIKARTSGGPN